MRLRRTVLPTPLKPTIIKLLAERPRATRPNATSASVRIVSRPASSGGGEPAPGAKGLATASILGCYKIIADSTNKLINSVSSLIEQVARLSQASRIGRGETE